MRLLKAMLNFPYFIRDIEQGNNLSMIFSLEKDIEIADRQMLVSLYGERFSIEARRGIKLGLSFIVTAAQQDLLGESLTWIDIEPSASKILKGAKSEEILPLTKGRWLSHDELLSNPRLKPVGFQTTAVPMTMQPHSVQPNKEEQ